MSDVTNRHTDKQTSTVETLISVCGINGEVRHNYHHAVGMTITMNEIGIEQVWYCRVHAGESVSVCYARNDISSIVILNCLWAQPGAIWYSL